MELTCRNWLTIHRPASVRLLHRFPAGWEAGDNTFSQAPYIPYRWHHVVGQVQGDRIELFLNGELSSSLSIRPEHADVSCLFVLGRLTALPGTGISVDRPFVGRMDEVGRLRPAAHPRGDSRALSTGCRAARPVGSD